MKAVIFDLDGTIVDNMTVHHKAWQHVLSTLGLHFSFDEIKEKIHGVNEEILHNLFGAKYTLKERKEIAANKESSYRRIFTNELKLIEGLDRLFEELKTKRVPMAVATAAPKENTDFVLDNLGIRHYFQSVIHADLVHKGKPHPEVLINTSHQLGISLNDCIMFEDSPTGAQTAMNADCKTIIITTTHEKEEFKTFPNVIKFIKDYSSLSVDSLSNLWKEKGIHNI